MSRPPQSTIAAIIPTCRRPKILSDTLQSVFRQSTPPGLVVVSVPKGSLNDIEQRWLDDPRILATEAPPGLTSQFNFALDALPDHIEWVLKFDDDIELHRQYIELAIEALQEQQEALALTGSPLAPGCPSRDQAIEVIESISPQSIANTKAYASNGTWKLYGCNIAFKRRAFDFARFDERIPDQGFMDDWDISVALEKHGQLLCHTGCFLVHLQVPSGRSPGTKFGYAQVTVAKHLHRKKTMTTMQFIKFAAVTFPGSNLLHGMKGDRNIDRFGRLWGNAIAWLDILMFRSRPEGITQRFG